MKKAFTLHFAMDSLLPNRNETFPLNILALVSAKIFLFFVSVALQPPAECRTRKKQTLRSCLLLEGSWCEYNIRVVLQ